MHTCTTGTRLFRDPFGVSETVAVQYALEHFEERRYYGHKHRVSFRHEITRLYRPEDAAVNARPCIPYVRSSQTA